MQQLHLFQDFLQQFQNHLEILEDKPEETPVSTLRALWFRAAGDTRSVQAAQHGTLPELNDTEIRQLTKLVARRLNGVPLAHILERQQFMGIELLSGPEALVPRKETEILGAAAIALLKEINAAQGRSLVIDVCTGSGNLAIAYAVHAPESMVYGADLSTDAVKLAQRNAEFVGITDRVEFREGDLLAPFTDERFARAVDLLTCNPPYISSAKVDKMHAEIANHEPRLAFDGGPFGVKILQRLTQEAPHFIKPGGWLAFEVGVGQGPAWVQRLTKHEKYDTIEVSHDEAGEIRVIKAQRADN